LEESLQEGVTEQQVVELVRSLQTEGEYVSETKYFIKVLAAFTPDGADQFEELGIELEPGMEEYRPVHLSIPRIMATYENKRGGLNIEMSNGNVWSTPADAAERINTFLGALSIDLSK
jgi:hypothetical protein